MSGDVDFDIASLTVGDVEVELTGEEQTIDVAGLASITINDETLVTNSSGTSARGSALTVTVLETGAVAEIGFASATVNGGAPAGLVGGQAYGSSAKVGGTVTSSPLARVTAPCLGTGGKERVNSVASFDLGAGLGTVGGVRNTVVGTTSPTPTQTSTSEIADVSLLGGTVVIEGVDVEAKAWRDSRGRINTSAETDVLSVKVAGIEIDLPELDGGTVGLPGVGTLTVGETKKTGDGIRVTGLRLSLLNGTADVVIGYAEASAKRAP